MLSAILLQNTPEAMALTKSFLVALLTTSMLVADEATNDGERGREQASKMRGRMKKCLRCERVDEINTVVYKVHSNI